jgi:hypothetical protein
MKKKKLKELIQGPLRFHHQDIHEELDEIKNILNQLSFQVIELKKELAELKPKPFKSTGCAKCGTGTTPLTVVSP